MQILQACENKLEVFEEIFVNQKLLIISLSFVVFVAWYHFTHCCVL